MIAITLVDGDRSVDIITGTDAWRASLEWARFHGLDPNRIPAGSVLERDASARQIRYVEFARASDGDLLIVDSYPVEIEQVEQGEAPPLPFPSEAF
jgi:hypothetical protein